MRTLWNVVAFLAVVNLLGLLLFAGWLGGTGRLSRDRIDRVREIFAGTVTAEERAASEAATAAERAGRAATEAAWAEDPPLPSAARIRSARLLADEEEAAMRRIIDETGRREAELAADLALLAQERADFEAEREAWLASTMDERSRIEQEQFAKTVKLYETSPPRNVKLWIERLVAERGVERAVDYVEAMNPRAAKKVLALFKTEEDAALATDLLERIRARGVPVPDEELPADAEPDSATEPRAPASR